MTGGQQRRAHIAAEQHFGEGVIDVEVRRRVQIMRGDELQPGGAQSHFAAFIGNVAQIGVERAVMADKAAPQLGHMPGDGRAASVPQRQAGGDVGVLMADESGFERAGWGHFDQGAEHLREDLESARIEDEGLVVHAQGIDVGVDDAALVLVVDDVPVVVTLAEKLQRFHSMILSICSR